MNDYLQTLNKEQKKAVLKTEGPLLIIAGAGAGKTKTITTRIIHLILNGVRPDNILAITFTNKSAKEMRERVMHNLQNIDNLHNEFHNIPFVSTFHSLGVYILKNFGNEIGLHKNFSILDRDDTKKKLKEIIINLGHDPKKIEPSKVISIISKQKGNNVSIEQYTERALQGKEGFIGEIISTIWQKYQSELTKEKSVDFDDLLSLPVKIIKNNNKIKEIINNKWQYIHVDEYQDTNKIQYELCKLLAGDKHNIAVVGDADQTIYSWRGANIGHILEFEHDFEGTEVVLLEQNYRSTANIIEAANAIIEKNLYRKKKNLYTEKESGENITLYTALDENDEGRYVAMESKKLIDNGIKPESICVLYRANFQSRALEEGFISLGVNYQVLGTKFFERKEIKDMLAYLKASLNRDSITDMKRIINTPTRGIGQVSVLKMIEGKLNEINSGTRLKIEGFFRLLDNIKNKTNELKLSELLKYIFKESGLEKYLNDSGTEDDIERTENIKELISLSIKFETYEKDEAIEKFLEEAALMSDQDELDNKKQDKSAVRLMTVHASKGLEFPYVFICGLENGLFPYERMDDEVKKDEDNEEERRLFYVAITRAGHKLYLSTAMMRTIFGNKQFSNKSIFLDDIPSKLIENIEVGNGIWTNKSGRKGGLLDLDDISF